MLSLHSVAKRLFMLGAFDFRRKPTLIIFQLIAILLLKNNGFSYSKVTNFSTAEQDLPRLN